MFVRDYRLLEEAPRQDRQAAFSGTEFDEHDPQPDGKQAGEEVGTDVGEGEKRLVVEEEAGGVPAEGGEGGEAAEEADDNGMAKGADEEQFGSGWLDGGISREPLEQLSYHPNQQTADEVDQKCGHREVLSGGMRESKTDAVPGEGTEGAAEGDEEGVTHGEEGVSGQGDRRKPELQREAGVPPLGGNGRFVIT